MAYSRQYKSSISAIKQISKLSSGRISTWDKYHSVALNNKLTAGNKLTENQANWLKDYRERREIAKEVIQIIENDNYQAKPSQNPVRPTSPKDAGKVAESRSYGWRTSLQDVSIACRAGYAYGNLYFRNKASTDNIQMKQTRFRTAESAAAIGLSLIPVYGPALASTFSFATQIFSTHISNSIQRRGDRRRVAYKFANNDLGKYGTYAYDNTTNEWVNQDANKVKAKILGKKTSV